MQLSFINDYIYQIQLEISILVTESANFPSKIMLFLGIFQ